MKYYICSKCGSHLDPGERCDCDSPHGTHRAEKTPPVITYAPPGYKHATEPQAAVRTA